MLGFKSRPISDSSQLTSEPVSNPASANKLESAVSEFAPAMTPDPAHDASVIRDGHITIGIAQLNTWFRLYNEVHSDPKVQTLPDRLFKAWINFMCLANANGGTLPAVTDIAFRLHLTLTKASQTLKELTNQNLFEEREDGEIVSHNWNNRQFKSDVSTERVKRFRNGQRNVSDGTDETFPLKKEKVSPTPPSKRKTESDSETDSEAETAVETASFDWFWKHSTRRGSKVEALTAWKKLKPDPELADKINAGMNAWQQSEQWQDETKQPHIHRWLKRRGWEEIVPNVKGVAPQFPAKIESVHHARHRCVMCEPAHMHECDDPHCDYGEERVCAEFLKTRKVMA